MILSTLKCADSRLSSIEGPVLLLGSVFRVAMLPSGLKLNVEPKSLLFPQR